MMTDSITALLLVLCISWGVSGVPRSASIIRNGILSKAEPHVRPAGLTVINTTFVLTSLNNLNTVSQELSTTFLLHMTWTDPRLEWDRQPGEPEHLLFYVREVWTPPLIVSNAIKDAVYLLSDKDKIVPMQVSSNGTVIWAPSLSPLTTCEINIAKFPVDEQTCYINITTWVHSTSELDLRESGTEQYQKPATLELYNDKAWHLHALQVNPQKYTGVSGLEFKMLTYTLCFKRQEKFHWALLIIPFCCIASLMPLVFLIPSQYQDSKVAYSVTLMLAFQLYVNLLQTLLPPVFTEGEKNYLGEYTSYVTIYGTVITSLLVIELLIRHKTRKYREPISGTVYGKLQAGDAIVHGQIIWNINGNEPADIEGCLTVDSESSASPTVTSSNTTEANSAGPATSVPGINSAQGPATDAAPTTTLGTYKNFTIVSSSPTHVVAKTSDSDNHNKGFISIHLNGERENESGNFEGKIIGIVLGNEIKNCSITGTFICTCSPWTKMQDCWGKKTQTSQGETEPDSSCCCASCCKKAGKCMESAVLDCWEKVKCSNTCCSLSCWEKAGRWICRFLRAHFNLFWVCSFSVYLLGLITFLQGLKA